jgi:hypothetical protein
MRQWTQNPDLVEIERLSDQISACLRGLPERERILISDAANLIKWAALHVEKPSAEVKAAIETLRASIAKW